MKLLPFFLSTHLVKEVSLSDQRKIRVSSTNKDLCTNLLKLIHLILYLRELIHTSMQLRKHGSAHLIIFLVSVNMQFLVLEVILLMKSRSICYTWKSDAETHCFCTKSKRFWLPQLYAYRHQVMHQYKTFIHI